VVKLLIDQIRRCLNRTNEFESIGTARPVFGARHESHGPPARTQGGGQAKLCGFIEQGPARGGILGPRTIGPRINGAIPHETWPGVIRGGRHAAAADLSGHSDPWGLGEPAGVMAVTGMVGPDESKSTGFWLKSRPHEGKVRQLSISVVVMRQFQHYRHHS
jgi:hypothetical protein